MRGRCSRPIGIARDCNACEIQPCFGRSRLFSRAPRSLTSRAKRQLPVFAPNGRQGGPPSTEVASLMNASTNWPGRAASSPTDPGPVEKLISVIFCANVLLLLAANHQSTWDHTIMVLPWLLVLGSRALRLTALRIVAKQKVLTAASIVLAALIALGCANRECAPPHFDAIYPPVLWIPIAAFSVNAATAGFRSLFGITGLAILWVCVVMAIQAFVDGEPRPRGLSFNVLSGPMILAMLCLMGAMRGFPANRRKSWINHGFWLVATVGIFGAILSQSRTAWMSFMAGALVYVWRTPTGRVKAAIVATVIAATWAGALTDRYRAGQIELAKMEQGRYIRSSMGERTDCLKWGLSHLTDAPLLGKGSQALQDQLAMREFEWHRPGATRFFLHHLHNDYLQVAVEHGWPAMVCFVFTWATLVRQAAHRRRPQFHSDQQGQAQAWVLAMTAVYLSAFATDSFTYWVYTWATASCCFGIGIALLIVMPDATGSGPATS